MDMNKLFEDFVTQALVDRVPDGTHVRPQDPKYLDLDNRVGLRPDVVTYSGGAAHKVLDCKYKNTGPGNFINTDVYQVLAYAQAYDVGVGLIVYPSSEVTDPKVVHVRNEGPTIQQVTINLDGDRTEMDEGLDRLGDQVFDLIALPVAS